MALTLSMHSAEASTPEPTYGTPASSSIPWTRAVLAVGAVQEREHHDRQSSPAAGVTAGRGSMAVPVASSRSAPSARAGSSAAPRWRAAMASSARTHWPSRVMPTASSS